MIAYFDASTVAMLVFQDTGWRRLERWPTNDTLCAFGDFGWGELVSAVSIRLRGGQATLDAAMAFLARAGSFTADWQRADLQQGDVAAATELVSRFDLALRLPDAIHVAVARRLDATLVTADRRQAAAARAIGLAVFNPHEEP